MVCRCVSYMILLFSVFFALISSHIILSILFENVNIGGQLIFQRNSISSYYVLGAVCVPCKHHLHCSSKCNKEKM